MARKAPSWVLALFALPFAAVGIGFLLIGVLPTLHDWGRMQGWQQTEAQLLSARLERHSDSDATTYRATASYRYSFGGREYDGSRVAIGSSADNIGDFQARLGLALEKALREQRTVAVWVNPSAPAEAVIDRSLRPALLMFQMVFVLLFGGFGIGMLVVWWRGRRAPPLQPQVDTHTNTQPWLARPAWADNRIPSQKRTEVRLAWGFALVWNLIAVSVTLAIVPNALQSGNHGALLVLLFPLAGLGVVIWAIRATRDLQRHGDPRLVLDPFPGAIGGHVGGVLELPLRYDPALRFMVTLNCIHHADSHQGRSREARERLVWQAEGVAQLQATAGGTRLGFRFEVPDNLPPSQEPDEDYHQWRVDIESRHDGVPFKRRYDLPVFATGQRAAQLHDDAAAHPAMRARREEEIDAVSDLERIPGGVRIHLPYGRALGATALWLLFGLVFGGFGVGAGVLGAPLLFPVVFCAVGGLIILSSFYAMCNSLLVQLDHRGLQTERRLLGLVVARHQAGRADVRVLRLQESYSTQTSGKHLKVYRIVATLASGKAITIADSLRGRATAEAMLQEISRLADYPVEAAQGAANPSA